MMIDRRNFVTGVALTTMVPALPLLAASPPTLATELSPLALRIEGWSDPGESGAPDDRRQSNKEGCNRITR